MEPSQSESGADDDDDDERGGEGPHQAASAPALSRFSNSASLSGRDLARVRSGLKPVSFPLPGAEHGTTITITMAEVRSGAGEGPARWCCSWPQSA